MNLLNILYKLDTPIALNLKEIYIVKTLLYLNNSLGRLS